MSLMHSFKKNLNRAGTSLMQRTGAVDRTEDAEFNEEYERFKTLSKKVEKLSKQSKNYLDAIRNLTAAQRRISQTLGRFIEPLSPAMMQYGKVMDKLDDDARAELDTAFRTAVLEPLTRLCSYYPVVDEAIKRRNKKALDYDSQRAKVRKLIDKPSEDPHRLPVAEEAANLAREQYEGLNTILIEDLPKLVELRVPYIDPCFEALTKAELKFAQTSYEEIENLRPLVEQEGHKGNVDDILGQMRQLTICGNY
ncbi:hypothetical protein BJV82DRAFT_632579 [Fennellomyces sp. T-0311]|nr:hypothetical protein BJV82DRAFT_632579 [Fennellomyces sp. T-0311]